MSEKSVIGGIKLTQDMMKKAGHKKLLARRRKMIGAIVGITVSVSALGVGCSNIIGDEGKDNTSVATSVDTSSDVYSFDIATDEILDLTLVNDGCDDVKFADAVKELQSTGYDCKGVDIDDLDVNNIDTYFSIGITSYEGNDTKVIANVNPVNPASDQLAVAMSVSSGHDATDIQKGVHDLGETDGSFRPSDLEEKVNNLGMPNITVAYPSDKPIDTDEILEACARVTDYYKQDGHSASDEILYRVKPGDSPYSLGSSICGVNGIDDTDVLDGNRVLLMRPLSGSFSKDAIIDIEKVDVKSNSLN